MPVIKRKTRKAITKQVKKLVNKHGPEVALGLATNLVGSVVDAVSGKTQAKSKKKGASGKKRNKNPELVKIAPIKTDETPRNKKKQAASKKKETTSGAQS